MRIKFIIAAFALLSLNTISAQQAYFGPPGKPTPTSFYPPALSKHDAYLKVDEEHYGNDLAANLANEKGTVVIDGGSSNLRQQMLEPAAKNASTETSMPYRKFGTTYWVSLDNETTLNLSGSFPQAQLQAFTRECDLVKHRIPALITLAPNFGKDYMYAFSSRAGDYASRFNVKEFMPQTVFQLYPNLQLFAFRK